MSASWIESATTPPAPQVEFGKLIPGYAMGYGYQWWLPQDPLGSYAAEGVHFQFLFVNPHENLLIVKTSVLDDHWNADLDHETWAAFAAIARALHR